MNTGISADARKEIAGFAQLDGGGGIVLGLVGVVLLVTGALGWCPIYAAFETRTARLTGADV